MAGLDVRNRLQSPQNRGTGSLSGRELQMYPYADPAPADRHELAAKGIAMSSARSLDREEHMVPIAADEQEHGSTDEGALGPPEQSRSLHGAVHDGPLNVCPYCEAHWGRKLATRVRTPALLARHRLTHATFAISWPRSSASAAVLK